MTILGSLFLCVRGPGRFHTAIVLALLVFLGASPSPAASPPLVTNVVAQQRAGTKLVDITYSLSDPNPTNVAVNILVSSNSGSTFDVPAGTFTGSFGAGISAGTNPATLAVVWDAGTDWSNQFTTNCRVRILANDLNMPLISGGTYVRGNISGDSDITNAPPYPVSVTDFFMDSTLVTGSNWLRVLAYAGTNGYRFEETNTSGTSAFAGNNDYPALNPTWSSAVKWCNARSEMEGLTPVYYTDASQTVVLKTGTNNISNTCVKWTANGYRLPTEAEWEKAARGGLFGRRFPWGDTIRYSLPGGGGQAAYSASGNANPPYDFGPNSTSFIETPAASYPPNGYGLFDMGNDGEEWCWDWYSPTYYASNQSDPIGPDSGTHRVARGGAAFQTAPYLRCASRGDIPPNLGDQLNAGPPFIMGFRCVRRL